MLQVVIGATLVLVLFICICTVIGERTTEKAIKYFKEKF